MPTFNLKLKFEVDGPVKAVVAPADKMWHLKLECANCGENSGKFTTVQEGEMVEVPGGRGHAHLVQKCKMCERQNNVSIVERKEEAAFTSEDAAEERFVTMASFECRGVQIIAFEPMGGWTVKGPGDSEFTDVDLSDKEWTEFEEESEEVLTILGVEHEIEVAGASDGHSKHSHKHKSKHKKKH